MPQQNNRFRVGSSNLGRDLLTLAGITVGGLLLKRVAVPRPPMPTDPNTSRTLSAGKAISTAPNASFAEGAGNEALGLDSAPYETRTQPNSKVSDE